MSTLAFELIQQAPPFFARSRSLDQFVTPPKTRFAKASFSGVAENSSDRERAKKGEAEHQTCWITSKDFFESTPILSPGELRIYGAKRGTFPLASRAFV